VFSFFKDSAQSNLKDIGHTPNKREFNSFLEMHGCDHEFVHSFNFMYRVVLSVQEYYADVLVFVVASAD